MPVPPAMEPLSLNATGVAFGVQTTRTWVGLFEYSSKNIIKSNQVLRAPNSVGRRNSMRVDAGRKWTGVVSR